MPLSDKLQILSLPIFYIHTQNHYEHTQNLLSIAEGMIDHRGATRVNGRSGKQFRLV
jgi:hypothetical protein